MPGEKRSVARRLRWHYSLSDLAAALTKACGAEFVIDSANVFCAMLRCTARRFRSLASEPHMPRRVLSFWMGATTLSPALPWQASLSHAEQHGAGADWTRDLAAVVQEYAQLRLDESPEARFIDLIENLPRAKSDRDQAPLRGGKRRAATHRERQRLRRVTTRNRRTTRS